jgi:hypothetical protein
MVIKGYAEISMIRLQQADKGKCILTPNVDTCSILLDTEIKITRYYYNLTIMKSLKPATDNRFKWTLCIVTNSELDFLQSFWKWRPVEIFQWRESIRDIIIYPYIKFWIFTAHFLCHVLAAILKMQNCYSNGDLSLCQILCLYHYPFRSYQH